MSNLFPADHSASFYINDFLTIALSCGGWAFAVDLGEEPKGVVNQVRLFLAKIVWQNLVMLCHVGIFLILNLRFFVISTSFMKSCYQVWNVDYVAVSTHC